MAMIWFIRHNSPSMFVFSDFGNFYHPFHNFSKEYPRNHPCFPEKGTLNLLSPVYICIKTNTLWMPKLPNLIWFNPRCEHYTPCTARRAEPSLGWCQVPATQTREETRHMAECPRWSQTQRAQFTPLVDLWFFFFLQWNLTLIVP